MYKYFTVSLPYSCNERLIDFGRAFSTSTTTLIITTTTTAAATTTTAGAAALKAKTTSVLSKMEVFIRRAGVDIN